MKYRIEQDSKRVFFPQYKTTFGWQTFKDGANYIWFGSMVEAEEFLETADNFKEEYPKYFYVEKQK